MAFQQDTADQNPLIRALAIRTMSTLRAEKILSYLGDPLSRCLRDENPYVRKTAALCVAKVYELKPELCVDYGFIDVLRDLVGDGNPMVVANAVTALSDIHEASILAAQNGSSRIPRENDDEDDVPSPTIPPQKFAIDGPTLSRILLALNECSEWGRIALLNALAKYQATGSEESEHICERVMPQFQHANGAVVLGAVKVSEISLMNVVFRTR
jgi:AP-1 complex subunit beta-1